MLAYAKGTVNLHGVPCAVCFRPASLIIFGKDTRVIRHVCGGNNCVIDPPRKETCVAELRKWVNEIALPWMYRPDYNLQKRKGLRRSEW